MKGRGSDFWPRDNRVSPVSTQACHPSLRLRGPFAAAGKWRKSGGSGRISPRGCAWASRSAGARGSSRRRAGTRRTRSRSRWLSRASCSAARCTARSAAAASCHGLRSRCGACRAPRARPCARAPAAALDEAVFSDGAASRRRRRRPRRSAGGATLLLPDACARSARWRCASRPSALAACRCAAAPLDCRGAAPGAAPAAAAAAAGAGAVGVGALGARRRVRVALRRPPVGRTRAG